VDGTGYNATAYATAPDIDRRVMEAIRAMTRAELVSAERGRRPLQGGTKDLVATLALGDWETAERLFREIPRLLDPGGASDGALHLMAKRNDVAAVQWLLDHHADPNARWSHWDADVTPLHLAVLGGHPDIVRRLLNAGADPRIRDSKHDSDAIGWAEFFGRQDIIRLFRAHREST
jgi:SAM-dependent methyltransferase